MTGPRLAAMPGSVTKALPPITPAKPASAAPPPNTSMNTRGTLWPKASTVSGCVSAAWITRPMRVRVSSNQMASNISRATNIMKPRYMGNCVPYRVNRGPASSAGTR